jgi:hypothetical protein
MAHLLTDGPAPIEYVEMSLAERFGWTLDYVRSLSLADGLRLMTMLDAQARAMKANRA